MSKKYPNRYVITALVKAGEYKGQRVQIYYDPEGGGWWQWTTGDGKRFESNTSDEFRDALRCAKGETWTKSSCGPWYYEPDLSTIEVREVPARVRVIVD